METENNIKDKIMFNKSVKYGTSNNHKRNDEKTFKFRQHDSKKDNGAKKVEVPYYKSAPAAIIIILLMWMPLFVVFFPGWIYTNNLSDVFLFQGCIRWSMHALFIICLMDIVISSRLLRVVSPVLFGAETWASFDNLKQRKLISMVIFVMMAISCSIQLVILVAPQSDLEEGLFGNFNMGESNVELQRNDTARTCEGAGITMKDATALRAWYLLREPLIAYLSWELAFIPEQAICVWVHHLLTILLVGMLVEPQMQVYQTEVLPLLDQFAVFPMIVATVTPIGNIGVIMYHYNHKNPKRQAVWMLMSALLLGILLLPFHLILPYVWVIKNYERLGGALIFGMLFTQTLFTILDGRVVWIKLLVSKKKAATFWSSDKNNLSFAGELKQSGETTCDDEKMRLLEEDAF